MSNQKIPQERINQFLSGKDPMAGIINIECGYQDDRASVIYKDSTNNKKIALFEFHPFVWAKQEGARKLFIDPKTGKQDKELLRTTMSRYNITAKGLQIHDEDGNTTERMENGYRVLFQCTTKSSFNRMLMFFKQGGVDIFKDKSFLSVSPVEQYMMRSGKRMFKGFEDYDDLNRLNFDLETQGLDPKIHGIEQIGISNNKGFEHIIAVEGETEEERRGSELIAIHTFFEAISEMKPDVITGYNSENFDWNFIIERCNVLGTNIADLTKEYFKKPLYKKKKPTVLKLGGETEYFNQTIMWGHNITDTLHAVRRAQAIDSNLKLANLKYVTKYLDLKKQNRVYVPGDSISRIWNDETNSYALNNENGEWFVITDDSKVNEGTHNIVTGKYIVERYLLDDLYETDKVELQYNQANFLLGKILPTTFSKVCTMGTAGTWKLIMMAWSYENNLAIPDFAPPGKFTGGLSRLLNVGFVDRVVKLDYNSLYPAITLTWDIKPYLDITNVMMSLLGYILDKREEYKELKGDAKDKASECKLKLSDLLDKINKDLIEKEIKDWKQIESANDKKQLPFKIFANSFFGSFGAPNIFPWGDLKCAEKITCIGRQSLRLLVKWFTDRGYKSIVMDTDGVNFSLPENYDFETKGASQRTYIGKGLNRNTIEGKVYYGVGADVAEFADLYLRGKMGLGIDEYAIATINFSRKNYADLLENGKVKLVGNSIKSKKMPVYIENFLGKGILQLLNNKGKEFLDDYYSYIERIYNYDIPLNEIASKGKIKKSIKDYKINCKGVNKKGVPNSRQAWYELCIKNNIEPDLGDTVYYINIGKKKADADVKREAIYKTDSEGKFVKVDSYKNGEPVLTAKGKQKTEKVKIGDEIVLNCIMIPSNLIENGVSLSDMKDSEYENIEYNVPKYIDQFNNKIKPLLVCFNKDIRDSILITNPNDRKFFTEKECILTSGQPNKIEDQDTYEQLMTIEDKEISFWKSVNEEPVFINDIGLPWDNILNDYEERLLKLKDEKVKIEIDKYNTIIDELTEDFIKEFNLEPEIPKELLDFLDFDYNTFNFISKENNVIIGNIYDIMDKTFNKEEVDEIISDGE